MNSVISEKLKNLPAQPGVYIMRDIEGTVIYVGKAKILKNRVRQYFQKNSGHTPKVLAMISKINDFEYIITDSEFEALCLECNLIKKHKPKYNILLKDDKHYPFIKISNEEYPKISLVRRPENDKSSYFGPYPNASVIYETIEIIKKLFKIQHCKKTFPRDIGKERPCLYYSMKKCSAPCLGHITGEDYKETFREIRSFLEGNHSRLIKKLESEMMAAAEEMEFERAAQIRDKIEGIRKIARDQKVIGTGGRSIDVFALAIDDDIAVFETFFVRDGKLLGSDTHKENGGLYLDEGSTLASYIEAYYNRDIEIPGTVICAYKLPDSGSLMKWLTEKKGKNVLVRTPQRGEFKELAEMALKNCRHSISEYKIEVLSKNNKDKALSELREELGLDKNPERIEAFDVSNTGGNQNVASMVVFEGGKKAPSEYKRFKIKYTESSNDYECMREAVARRFMRLGTGDKSFDKLPSLILIDGGLAHLNAAREVLIGLDIKVPVFGMVKDDRHRTRGVVNEEGQVLLKQGSPSFRLVTQIQDEAHRFAVEYHKKLRGKRTFSGELESISGVGEARRKALMKHFKSVSAIKNAGLRELQDVPGIDKRTAQNVFDFFSSKP